MLDLTRIPAHALTPSQQEQLCSIGFDASWHGQIFPHRRYRELFERRGAGAPFSTEDLRDLQVWATLAWFDADFRAGPVRLVTGETVGVHALARKGRRFSTADVRSLLDAQRAVLCAIVPLYRALQERGQVGLTASPAFHPILPLLVDTEDAIIDRPGASLPRRFAHPEDADAQVRIAVQSHTRRFGREPSGMWPSEGAVSEAIVPIVQRHGIGWVGTDQAVLGGSGQRGYDTSDPDVVCRARSVDSVAILFRDTELSDAIGFRYGSWADPDAAAADLVGGIQARATRLGPEGSRVLFLALDGENAWGGYRDDGRPFLRALYRRLCEAPDLATTTPAAWLANAAGVPALGKLATGSWIDENGSQQGNDLGTWIGEVDENRAWELLADLHDALDRSPPSSEALGALYAAEGSDFTWWLGDDQDSGHDGFYDALFRAHLRRGWRGVGEPVPDLDAPMARAPTPWTFTSPARLLSSNERLVVRTNCPGTITWRVDDDPRVVSTLAAVGGTMAGVYRHERVIGPFPPAAHALTFTFHCADCRCTGAESCCAGVEQVVRLLPPASEASPGGTVP